MANTTLTLAADTTAVTAIADELSLLAAQCPPELADAFGERVINLFEQGRDFGTARLTSRTPTEFTIALVPSDDLRAILDAARAGNF